MSYYPVFTVADPGDTNFRAELTYFYHPQRSCGKVMFSQVSDILYRGEGEWVCVADTPGQTPPPGRHPLGRHLSGRHPPRQTPPGRHPLGRRHLPSACWDTMATAADVMHPIGTHSCLAYFCRKLHKNVTNW